MPQPRILVTRNIPRPALERLDEVFELELHASDTAIPRDRLLDAVQDKDALLCLLTDAIDAELLDAAPASNAYPTWPSATTISILTTPPGRGSWFATPRACSHKAPPIWPGP